MDIADIKINMSVIVVRWTRSDEAPSITEGKVTEVLSDYGDTRITVRVAENRVVRCSPEDVFLSGAEASEYIRQLAAKKIKKLNEIMENPLHDLHE